MCFGEFVDPRIPHSERILERINDSVKLQLWEIHHLRSCSRLSLDQRSMAAGARYSHLPLSWHNQPACGPASTEPKVQKARPLRVHLSTRGSEQPFELQPAMKAMSEGSASGSALPTWVGRAWRVSIFKWAAIGQ